MGEKVSIRQKAGGKTLKELAHLRKEAREIQIGSGADRKPLASKSTNDDISSPRKSSKPMAMDEVAVAKAELIKSKPVKERIKSKPKTNAATKVVSAPITEIAPPTATAAGANPATPVPEPVLMSPNSPGPPSSENGSRGDTPPPADISLNGETSRASRRNRTTVSYAEPNLRDKMRRPTKELFDAVAGEGRYARRTSQCDQPLSEGPKLKRESDVDARDSLRGIPPATESSAQEPGSIPASPLARKSSRDSGAAATATTERGRQKSAQSRAALFATDLGMEADENDGDDVDLYEFTSSSPHIDNDPTTETTRTTRRGGAMTRRRSAAVDSDESNTVRERSVSRRRSMIV
jgi:hypothetical protein